MVLLLAIGRRKLTMVGVHGRYTLTKRFPMVANVGGFEIRSLKGPRSTIRWIGYFTYA
jgi:hypothetical protein